MPRYDYEISELSDLNRLDEIRELFYGVLKDSGQIKGNTSETVDMYPHLNKISETKIIIAELNGKIIGTNSVTLDGKAGLHTDKFFKKETDLIRKENKILGSSWRIATSKEYRKKIRLFLDLIQKTFFVAKNFNLETCLFVFNKKHENFYKKLLAAETIAEKICNIEPEIDIPMVLMKTDTKKSQKHLSDLFIKRKFY